MNLDIQFKIKNDPSYQRFLRENSSWYKYLNRDPKLWDEFVNDMKEKYHLRPSDKFNKMIDNISLMQAFLDVLK